jgi:hypothetical protein
MSDINNIQEEIRKAREEREVIDAALKKNVQQLFNMQIKELFSKQPVLNSFSWAQYTPYFNDGDECTFSVNREYIKINDTENDELEDLDDLHAIEHRIFQIKNKESEIAGSEAQLEVMKEAQLKGLSEINGRKGMVISIPLGGDWRYWINNTLKEIDYIKGLNTEDLPSLELMAFVRREIDSILENYTDEDLLEMFGDHCKVVVKRDGITTESYQHD